MLEDLSSAQFAGWVAFLRLRHGPAPAGARPRSPTPQDVATQGNALFERIAARFGG